MKPLPDSVPIRVPPLPGEAVDSWLEAYARRLQATVPELLALAAIRPPGHNALTSKPWTPARYPRDFAALGALTSTPVSELNNLTLARYDGALVTIAPTSRTPGPARWWLHFNGSRFCPQCLAENDGRWMLSWRLPWTFACTRHQCLLADACPSCGRRPRDNWRSTKNIHASQICRTAFLSEPILASPAGRRAHSLCGHSLAVVDTVHLRAGGQVMSTHLHVEQLIDAAVKQASRKTGS